WFVITGLRLARFQRLLRETRPADAELQGQAEALARQLGLRRSPRVLLVPGPLPPMLWMAFGPPRVLLPATLLGQLDDGERASLLAHELAHVRRRDHWVRWLEVVVTGLYWWFPLVRLARRRLQAHEEECCDAWVVGLLPARAYATAILRTLEFLAGPAPAVPATAS